jgi:membrane protein
VTARALDEARALLGTTGSALRGRDLTSAAATTTYFAAIAVVPWLLLAAWTTSWFDGAEAARRRLSELRVLVPPQMGARPAYDALVDAGAHLGVVGALIALLPASFYGEGLRRGALSLDPRPERFTGWRARLALLPLVVVLPALAWALVATSALLVPLSPEGGGGGLGDRLLRVVVGFTVTWLVLSVVLAWVFAVVMPGRPRAWVAVAGGLATGSFAAGFLHGFQLFLAIPVDVGAPFGGLGVAGAVAAVGLWLFVLHTVVLVGWAATGALERRAARGPEVGP